MFKIVEQELHYHSTLTILQADVNYYVSHMVIHGHLLFTRGVWPTDLQVWDINTATPLYRINESISIVETLGWMLDS